MDSNTLQLDPSVPDHHLMAAHLYTMNEDFARLLGYHNDDQRQMSALEKTVFDRTSSWSCCVLVALKLNRCPPASLARKLTAPKTVERTTQLLTIFFCNK
jgi:hypothetical protein